MNLCIVWYTHIHYTAALAITGAILNLRNVVIYVCAGAVFCVCVCVCVFACVRACVRACVCVRVCDGAVLGCMSVCLNCL